jgi:Ni,Fe-hydrogenase maturation factor
MSAAEKRVLVLGYGNPGREDDGLGPAFATEISQLGRQNVTVLDNYQLMIEDATAVADADVGVRDINISASGVSFFKPEILA